MPTYRYECEACGHKFEIMQSITEGKLKKCPSCHKMKLHRLVGVGSGFIFKGNGFFETDYKKVSPQAECSVAKCPAAKDPKACGCPASKGEK